MKNKGFTLIELLAVIVILAIIALIATPIILGIIKDSKEESLKRSIDGYANAVENAIVKYQLNTNESIKGNFKPNADGTKLSLNGEEKLNIEYDGNVVCDKIQVYEDGMFYLAGCKVNGDGEYTYGIKQTYDNGEIVYFDVANGIACLEETYKESFDGKDYSNSYTGYNGKNGTGKQNSCLKFYAFNDNGEEKVNLLLDHNTTNLVYWTTSSEKSNLNGPIELLEKLKQDTDSWVGTLTPEDYVHYQEYTQTSNGVTQDIKQENKVIYNTEEYKYKARLITVEEIEEIVNLIEKGAPYFYFATASTEDYLFDPGFECVSSGCKYGWLYDRTSNTCESIGCFNNSNKAGMYSEQSSYWTATPSFDDSAHYVAGGMVNERNVNKNLALGVRPVIEVLRSNLKQ